MEALTQYNAILNHFPFGKQNGDEWITNCPNPQCPNQKEHFYINLTTFKAHCFRCDLSFSGFRSLITYLNSNNHVTYSGFNFPKNGNGKLVEEDDDEETIISSVHFPITARWYLSRRGITVREIKEYKLLRGLGNWEDYVIFTCPNTGYQYGRKFKNDGDKKLRYKFPKGVPKKQSLFTHPNFWCENGKPYFSKNAILVEGAFDAIAIDKWASDPCAIALMGSSLTKEQETALRHHDKILVWLDPDAYSKGKEIGKKLTAWGLNVAVLNLFKEPADSNKEEILSVLRRLV